MKVWNRLMLLSAVVLAVSCRDSSGDYMRFLYGSMPLPDREMYSEAWWEANVAKTLEVRERMGWDVPEREFRHFVLPLRVNNETLDDFRLPVVIVGDSFGHILYFSQGYNTSLAEDLRSVLERLD